MNKAQEKAAFDEFMDGLCAEVKRTNKFNGRSLAEQADWDMMSSSQKDELVAWVLARNATLVVRVAREAIERKSNER
jgi:predicted Fe-S protein YdhL (DUF1289 family)